MNVFPKKAWTFLVYIAGDNDLDPSARQDLAEMRQFPSDEHLHVVAQFDSRDTLTYRYRFAPFQQEQLGLPLDDVNTGDPNSLTDFLTWGTQHFPADRTAFIIWNHGTGLKDLPENFNYSTLRSEDTTRSKNELRRTLFDATLDKLGQRQHRMRGIAIDATARDYLDTQELSAALAAANKGTKIDLLGFDACLMNVLEIAYEIRTYAHYMVGSQETEPGGGWPFHEILTALAANPAMTASQLGKTIVTEYSRSTGKKMREKPAPFTQSVIDLNQTDSTHKYLSQLVSKLLANNVQNHSVVQHGLRQIRNEVKRFKDRDLADLGHWCQLFRRKVKGPVSKMLRDDIEALTTHLEVGTGLVVANAAHGGDDTNSINGVSIYWPLKEYTDVYDQLQFAKSQWGELAKYSLTL